MRYFTNLSILVLMICFAAKNADACLCPAERFPCSSFAETPVVFVGKVASIEESTSTILHSGKTEVWTSLLAHFDVERRFKGIPENTDKVDIGTGLSDCMYIFEVGKRYIVYADHNRLEEEERKDFGVSLEWDLFTDICHRTRPLPEGQNDVDLIEALTQRKPETRIFGTVVLFEKDLASGPYETKNKGGISGMKIEVRNETGAYDTVTDEKGNFKTSNLPPGKYKVRPDISATQSSYLGYDLTWSEVEIRMPEFCGVELNYSIQTNGIIRGHVFDADGKTVGRNIEISLVTADSAMKDPPSIVGCSDWTNEDGAYEFNGLLPGDYIIGAGLLHAPDTRSPYSGVYYPSTSLLSEARIFHLEEGEKVNDIDIHLPPPLEQFTIRGTVFESNGRPAAGARIEIFDNNSRKDVSLEPAFPPYRTGADGVFDFTLFKDRSYRIRAYRPGDKNAGAEVQSDPIEIKTTDSLKPVVLKLNGPD